MKTKKRSDYDPDSGVYIADQIRLLSNREQDDEMIAGMLIEHGFEIENPIGWCGSSSAHIYGVSKTGNLDSLNRALESERKFFHNTCDGSPASLVRDRHTYVIVNFEPDWDELLEIDGLFALDQIRERLQENGRQEALVRLEAMTEEDKSALLNRLMADETLSWDYDHFARPWPHWDLVLGEVNPQSIY